MNYDSESIATHLLKRICLRIFRELPYTPLLTAVPGTCKRTLVIRILNLSYLARNQYDSRRVFSVSFGNFNQQCKLYPCLGLGNSYKKSTVSLTLDRPGILLEFRQVVLFSSHFLLVTTGMMYQKRIAWYTAVPVECTYLIVVLRRQYFSN